LFFLLSIVKDFNSFFPSESKRSLLKWTNDINNGLPLWRRILLCLSGISAFTNVLNVVLVIHGKISSYFWGILGAILYGSYSLAYGYAGDAQLFIFFYLPMQFIGILIWSNALDNRSTTRVKSLKLAGWFIVICLSLILACLFFYEIPFFSKYLTGKYLFENLLIPHLLDAITNALSVVGQCLLIFCYWEQYIFWACVNLILIVMYSGKVKQTDSYYYGQFCSCSSTRMC
jgi:nicotinamide mononucleotide transporter